MFDWKRRRMLKFGKKTLKIMLKNTQRLHNTFKPIQGINILLKSMLNTQFCFYKKNYVILLFCCLCAQKPATAMKQWTKWKILMRKFYIIKCNFAHSPFYLGMPTCCIENTQWKYGTRKMKIWKYALQKWNFCSSLICRIFWHFLPIIWELLTIHSYVLCHLFTIF